MRDQIDNRSLQNSEHFSDGVHFSHALLVTRAFAYPASKQMWGMLKPEQTVLLQENVNSVWLIISNFLNCICFSAFPTLLNLLQQRISNCSEGNFID